MNGEAKRGAGTIGALALSAALILILAGASLLTQITPAAAATSAGVQVSINVPDRVVPGSDFTATVNITQVVNFDAANYDISFNPAVFKLDNVTSGNIGGSVVPVEIWNERDSGRYTIVQNVPGLSGVSGSGSLAILRFHAIGSLSESTSLNLSRGVLSNTLATAIPATWSGALVQAVPTEPTLPASFSLSDFSVSPREVRPLEPVTVSVLVTNSGGRGGNYSIILKVNGVKEAESEVTLGSRQIRTVSFPLVKSAVATYLVDVNGRLSEFTVTVPPLTPLPLPPLTTPPETITPPPAAPPSTPLPPSDETLTPPPTVIVEKEGPLAESVRSPEAMPSAAAEVASPPLPPPPPPASVTYLDWPVVAGVIGGVVIVIGLLIFLRIRRSLY